MDKIFLRVMTRVTETSVPAVHHMFDFSREEIRAQYLYPLPHLSFHLIITLEVFSFKVFLWSREVEVIRHKVQAVWWMGKTFPVKLLQELHCDMGCVEVGLVMKKDYFLCRQARVFPLNDFLHVLQYCAVADCIHCFPLVQKLKEENALYVSKC
jgi:hypothetical protein